MMRFVHLLALAVVLVAPLSLRADGVIYGPAPTVSYYSAPAPIVNYYTPAPVVSYYAAPAVSYYTPAVSYYSAPAVSYYAPSVSYYAPAPTTVSTYRYGLFGRRGVTTVTYGSPAYVAAPVYAPRSYYVAPVRSYYYAPGYIYP